MSAMNQLVFGELVKSQSFEIQIQPLGAELETFYCGEISPDEKKMTSSHGRFIVYTDGEISADKYNIGVVTNATWVLYADVGSYGESYIHSVFLADGVDSVTREVLDIMFEFEKFDFDYFFAYTFEFKTLAQMWLKANYVIEPHHKHLSLMKITPKKGGRSFNFPAMEVDYRTSDGTDYNLIYNLLSITGIMDSWWELIREYYSEEQMEFYHAVRDRDIDYLVNHFNLLTVKGKNGLALLDLTRETANTAVHNTFSVGTCTCGRPSGVNPDLHYALTGKGNVTNGHIFDMIIEKLDRVFKFQSAWCAQQAQQLIDSAYFKQ